MPAKLSGGTAKERAKPLPRGASQIGEALKLCRAQIALIDGAKWPMVKYQKDPVAFVREQVGERPMRHQRRIMLAIAHSRTSKVAVRSGQKTGKTKLAVWLALWFYCCFPEARVFMTADTAPQIKRVLWPELLNTIAVGIKRKGFNIETPAANPETGLVSADNRSILGFTTRTIEGMAGLSGKNIFFIGDEASSQTKAMFDAVRGNTVGDGRILLISNPTRAEGPFFDIFRLKKKNWKRFHLSSEELAKENAAAGRRLKGVATLDNIREWEEDDGRDSSFFIIRALGEFVLDEQAKIASIHTITEAQGRHVAGLEGLGVLSMGIDCAGDGSDGDEWAFCLRRGARVVYLEAFRGLSEDAAVAKVEGLLVEYRNTEETPRINVDADGPIGSAFYGRLRGLANHYGIHDPRKAFDVWGIKGSSPARREPTLFERLRDEVWASAGQWLRSGAIPPSHKLEQELHAPGFLVTVNGKRRATPKDVIREKIGRSPDRADALCLAVWEPVAFAAEDTRETPPERVGAAPRGEVVPSVSGMNPYESSREQGGGFDPYRG